MSSPGVFWVCSALFILLRCLKAAAGQSFPRVLFWPSVLSQICPFQSEYCTFSFTINIVIALTKKERLDVNRLCLCSLVSEEGKNKTHYLDKRAHNMHFTEMRALFICHLFIWITQCDSSYHVGARGACFMHFLHVCNTVMFTGVEVYSYVDQLVIHWVTVCRCQM